MIYLFIYLCCISPLPTPDLLSMFALLTLSKSKLAERQKVLCWQQCHGSPSFKVKHWEQKMAGPLQHSIVSTLFSILHSETGPQYVLCPLSSQYFTVKQVHNMKLVYKLRVKCLTFNFVSFLTTWCAQKEMGPMFLEKTCLPWGVAHTTELKDIFQPIVPVNETQLVNWSDSLMQDS